MDDDKEAVCHLCEEVVESQSALKYVDWIRGEVCIACQRFFGIEDDAA